MQKHGVKINDLLASSKLSAFEQNEKLELLDFKNEKIEKTIAAQKSQIDALKERSAGIDKIKENFELQIAELSANFGNPEFLAQVAKVVPQKTTATVEFDLGKQGTDEDIMKESVQEDKSLGDLEQKAEDDDVEEGSSDSNYLEKQKESQGKSSKLK